MFVASLHSWAMYHISIKSLQSRRPRFQVMCARDIIVPTSTEKVTMGSLKRIMGNFPCKISGS